MEIQYFFFAVQNNNKKEIDKLFRNSTPVIQVLCLFILFFMNHIITPLKSFLQH